MSRYELEIHIDHTADELTVTTREVGEDQHWTLLDERTVLLEGRDAPRWSPASSPSCRSTDPNRSSRAHATQPLLHGREALGCRAHVQNYRHLHQP